MAPIATKINDRNKIIADLLQRADQLSSEGEKLGACFCIEAVFMLYEAVPEADAEHLDPVSRKPLSISQF